MLVRSVALYGVKITEPLAGFNAYWSPSPYAFADIVGLTVRGLCHLTNILTSSIIADSNRVTVSPIAGYPHLLNDM